MVVQVDDPAEDWRAEADHCPEVVWSAYNRIQEVPWEAGRRGYLCRESRTGSRSDEMSSTTKAVLIGGEHFICPILDGDAYLARRHWNDGREDGRGVPRWSTHVRSGRNEGSGGLRVKHVGRGVEVFSTVSAALTLWI